MRFVLGLAALLLTAADAPTPISVAVPTRTEPVSYAREVADILDAKCTGCHSSALAESKLSLEEVAGMLKGGKRGPAIVPRRADESLLFQMAAHRVEPVMPPKDKKDQTPLTPAELGLIKLWIDAGAPDDSAENTEPARPIELGELPPGVHPIVAVDMTADGARIAAGRANTVQVYDADSGLLIDSLGGHKDIIQSLRFSPDGKRLAAGSYQVVTVWEVPTGGLVQTLAGHTDQVKAVVALPDGSGVVSGGLDKTIRFWDQAGKPVRQIDVPAPVLALAISPDGKRLAVGGADNLVRVLDAADGKVRFTLTGHTKPVVGLAMLGSGAEVASASLDGTGRVWTLPEQAGHAPGDPLVLAGDEGPLHAVAVTPSGMGVATAGEIGEIRMWDGDGGMLMGTIAGPRTPILALAFSPKKDRVLVGCADQSARVFQLPGGRLLHTLTGHTGPVSAVAFSPDGTRLATAGGDGGIKVWEADTGRGVIAFGHSAPNTQPAQPVQALAFTGPGTLVSASADKTLKVWRFEGAWAERRPLGPHVFRVLAIDFSPDGKLLAAGGGEPSRSGEVKIWDVESGNLVRSLDSLHSDTVFGVRFSPDGKTLATGAADKLLKLVNVADGKELKALEGHTHHVLALDWNTDGKLVATGGADNVLKVWDVAAGEQLRSLAGEQLRSLPPAGKQITAVRWIPGKAEIAGASGDGLVRIWPTEAARRSAGILRTFSGAADYLFGLAVSKDGNRIAAGGADGVLFLWNGQNAQVLRKFEPPPPAKTPSPQP